MSETNKRGGEAIPVDIRARALVFAWGLGGLVAGWVAGWLGGLGVAGLVDVYLLACVPPPPPNAPPPSRCCQPTDRHPARQPPPTPPHSPHPSDVDKTTDVLSFPQMEEEARPPYSYDSGEDGVSRAPPEVTPRPPGNAHETSPPHPCRPWNVASRKRSPTAFSKWTVVSRWVEALISPQCAASQG